MAEREVPDLGRASGERQADQIGVVRVQRRRLAVERHQWCGTEPRGDRRKLGGIGDRDRVAVDDGERRATRWAACTPTSLGDRTVRDQLAARLPIDSPLCGSLGAAPAAPGPSRGNSEWNSSSTNNRAKACGSGGCATIVARSSSTGTSVLMVTRRRDSRAASACVCERLARALLLHLGGTRQQGLEVAELLQQLHGALFADPLHAGNVVRRVADQRQVVGDLRRRHAEPFAGVGFGHPDLFDTRRARPGRG